jgi:hypothetical protein
MGALDMRTWFTRWNGDTAHNNPATHLYVRGEPPNYPETRFNYRKACLADRFARHGAPAAGDLRELGWRTRAREAYGEAVNLTQLEQFASIRPGDLIVIPAERAHYDVHLGLVTSPRRFPTRKGAYYYHFDIAAGDWYENSHRVDVDWKRTAAGDFAVLGLPSLGGLWRRAFGPILQGHEELLLAATRAGLLS